MINFYAEKNKKAEEVNVLINRLLDEGKINIDEWSALFEMVAFTQAHALAFIEAHTKSEK